MKPYIHATIIFAGFVMAVGTTAIVTAEYKLVSTKGQVLLSVLDEVRSSNSREQAPLVAYRFEMPRDTNPFGNDVAGQLQSEVTPRAVYAPVVDIQSEPVRHAERSLRLTHLRQLEAKRGETIAWSAMRAKAPTPAKAITPVMSIAPTQPTPAVSLASFPKESSRSGLPAHFRILYSSDGKIQSMKMPGFGLKCTKDGVQFKLDEKVLALHEKEIEAQFKSPKNISTFMEMSPEDQAKLKELGAVQAGKQFEENQSRSMHEADSARQIAATNVQAALRDAGVTQITVDDSDFGG